MGLKVNITTENDTVYEAGIVRVQTVAIRNEDMEHIDHDGIFSFVSVKKAVAVVYVWPDETAFNNRAAPIEFFQVEFDYVDGTDAFEQAYTVLNKTKYDNKGELVNV